MSWTRLPGGITDLIHTRLSNRPGQKPSDRMPRATLKAQPALPCRRPPTAERRGRMSSPENNEPLRITAEDLATVTLPEPVIPGAMQPIQPGGKSYGSIADAADQ